MLVLIVLLATSVLAQDLAFECSEKSTLSSTAHVVCDLTASSDQSVQICVKDTCFDISPEDIPKAVVITLKDLSIGQNQFTATVKQKDHTIINQVIVLRSEGDLFQIINITNPATIEYSDSFNISFIVERMSDDPVEDIEISLKNQDRLLFSPDEIVRKQFYVVIEGKLLYAPLILEISYTDATGERISIFAEVPMELENLSFFEKIRLYFRSAISQMFI